MNSLPFWEEKCWGRVLHCFFDSSVAVSYLELKKGFRCSHHFHKHRHNSFILIEGEVIVEEWTSIAQYHVGTRPQMHRLLPGYSVSVPPGVLHCFHVTKSGKMIEVYKPGDDTTEVDLNDIERLDVGGPIF